MTGIVSLTATELNVNETDAFATVSFSRSGNTTGAVTISYLIIGDEATIGQDFVGGSGTVVIPAGAQQASIQIPINDDALSEATEAFIVSILSVSSGTLNAPRTTRVNILDDENPVIIDPEPPLTSRYEVTEVELFEALRPVAMQFMPGQDNIMFVADQIGRVWSYDVETGVRQRFIDLSDEVGFGRGLNGMVLHPNFPEDPYIYLYYSVDPPETASETGLAGPDGDGNRFQWLVRIEADPAADYRRAIPGSKVILLGGEGQSLDDISGGGALRFSEGEIHKDLPASDQINLSPAEIAAGLEYRQNFIKDDGDHTGGGMAFGPDGMLYIGIGDNAAFNFPDPRAFSVQDVNSLNGKILRIDPMTGEGLTDNPFYRPGDSLDLNRAKVFQYGLRNPYQISFTGEGELVVTDVGHSSYEEINIGAPGANFGWPFYEGADFDRLNIPPNYRPTTDNGFQDEWDAFLASNPQITLPFKGYSHRDADPGFQVQAIIGGVEYTGDRYPESLRGRYFFSDYAGGDVYTIDLDDRDSTEFLYSEPGVAPLRFIEGPDGYIYYQRPVGGGIGRLEITEIEPQERTIGSVIQVEGVDHNARSFSYGAGVELENPVFFSTVTQVGGYAVAVHFGGIRETGARVFLREPAASPNPNHAPETVSVVALEEGAWTVSDGRQLLVGVVNVGSDAVVTVQFDLPFDRRPLLITQIQSTTGEPEWAVARTWGLTETGFSLRVQDERGNGKDAAPTTVGFMAIDYLNLGADNFEWNDIAAQAFSSGTRVTQRWTGIDLGASIGTDPIVAASIVTYRDSNPANLRADVRDDGSLSVRVQQQEPLPDGVERVPERVHGIAFEGEGALTGVDLLI